METKKTPEKEMEKIGSEKKQEIGAPKEKAKIAHEEHKKIEENIEQRLSDLESQLRRVQAEFENYKKRTDKERETLLMGGSALMVAKMLPILDEMEVAMHAIHHQAGAKEIKEGMEMIHGKFHSMLEREGLAEMKCLGESFDPYRHEAIRTAEGKEDGKVLEVLKNGYLFRGNVLRHAMVVVSRKKEARQEEAPKAGKKEEAK